MEDSLKDLPQYESDYTRANRFPDDNKINVKSVAILCPSTLDNYTDINILK